MDAKFSPKLLDIGVPPGTKGADVSAKFVDLVFGHYQLHLMLNFCDTYEATPKNPDVNSLLRFVRRLASSEHIRVLATRHIHYRAAFEAQNKCHTNSDRRLREHACPCRRS